MKKNSYQTIILLLLLFWYAWFFSRRIDLTTLDLGRHIRNGQMVLSGQWGVLRTNFYSYTQPSFKVINHHWGAGVVLYLIKQIFGFKGLSVFYLILNLAVFYIFFAIARKEAGFNLSFLLAVLLMPLLAARTEIRPEGFSYLFIALFFYILWRWRRGELAGKWLGVLPLLQLLWVNTHIYFIFGLGLVGLYWVDEVVKYWLVSPRRNLPRNAVTVRGGNLLGVVLGLTGLASLISPFGLEGLLYPFRIFANYGYDIVENKSVLFLENWGFNDPNLRLFEIFLAVLVISFILLWLRNRRQSSFIYSILALLWGGLGFMAIRNFSMFAFFALVILAYNFSRARLGIEKVGLRQTVLLAGFVFLNGLYFFYPKLPWGDKLGWGLAKGNERSVEFFKAKKLKGPIFNNYDLGGYLIYNFYPVERVFTDNRPEAYPLAHFKQVYIPAQEKAEVWQKLEAKYNFNVIYFSHRDYTPWGQKFLIDRVKDDDWAVIYYDPYVIIFLKRNDLNRKIIGQYEVSKKVFGL